MTKRWLEHRLDADQRPKILYEYWVTGGGEFPFDMLRYDRACPATGEDAAKMKWSYASLQGERYRSIKLRSYQSPTVEQWSSFNWSVGASALIVKAA